MIKIIKGNLVRQKTDAIINPINADIIFDKGIPSFIKRNGGSKIEDEAFKNYPAHLGDVFVTSGGNLFAKHIFHLINREFGKKTSYRTLKHAVIKALQKGINLGIRSISIPPIYNRFSPEITANIICDGIIEAIEAHPEIKNISMFLVIFDQNARDMFNNVFQNNLPDLTDKNYNTHQRY